MSVDHIKSDLRYGYYLLERTGLTEDIMDKIKSLVKNASPAHFEAYQLMYAEDVH